MVRCRTHFLRPARATQLERFRREWTQRLIESPPEQLVQYPSPEATTASYSGRPRLTRSRSETAISSSTSLFRVSPSPIITEFSPTVAMDDPIIAPPPPTPEPVSPGSPMHVTPTETALVRIFDLEDPVRMLQSVLGDSVLQVLFRILLGPAAHLSPITSDDVIKILDHGETWYRLRPILSHQYRRFFDSLAAIILCAGNDHNPWVNGTGRDIPAGLPHEALIDAHDRIPGVLLFRLYLHLTFEELRFRSEAEALAHGTTLQKVCRHTIFWIANAIRLSVEAGWYTRWNWGAPIGMSRIEFIHRVSRHFSYNGYSDLAMHVANRAERSEVDFGATSFLIQLIHFIYARHAACARLINPDATHLIYTNFEWDPMEGPQCFIAVWPMADDLHLPVVGRDPAHQLVRLSLADGGIEDINDHLKQLALESEEDVMEVDDAYGFPAYDL
ncbi:hypothetical protein B0H16DRAFT_1815743 [Mycena metata]|uniref:Uncharacterized protein n=1 Tax=Mycena metata TaxID=1033252 RepID=A0AAD7H4M7_9AGAR|nr:hypothetical protein B0H16DRAFT_1815743 [Mycena metata]